MPWISKREYETLRREHDDAVAADIECEAALERAAVTNKLLIGDRDQAYTEAAAMRKACTRMSERLTRACVDRDRIRVQRDELMDVIIEIRGKLDAIADRLDDDQALGEKAPAGIAHELRHILDLAPTEPAEPLAPPPAAPNNVAAGPWYSAASMYDVYRSIAADAVQVQREVAARPRPCACGAPYGIACYCEQGKPVAG